MARAGTMFLYGVLAAGAALLGAQSAERPVTPQPLSVPTRGDVEAASRLIAFGEPALAERRLETALRQTPLDPSVMHALGALWLDERYQPSRAHDIYTRLIELDANDGTAHFGLAQAAFLLTGAVAGGVTEQERKRANELTRETLVHAERAAATLPSDPRPFFLMGEVHRLGAYDIAKDDPDRPAKVEQRRATALRFYRAALERDPAHADSSLAAAETALILDQASEALRHLVAYESLRAAGLAAHELKARIALRLSPPDFSMYARARARAAAEFGSLENQLAASLALRLAAMEDATSALEIFRASQAFAAEPSSAMRLRLLAPWLPESPPPSADVPLDEDDKTTPGQNVDSEPRGVVPELCYLAASTLFDSASHTAASDVARPLFERALTTLAPAAVIETDVPDAARLRALCLLRLQRWDEAGAAFSSVAELDPEDEHAPLYALIAPDLKAGYLTLEQFEAFLDIRSERTEFRRRLAALRGLARAAPRFALAHSLLGHFLRSAGEWAEALQAFENALKSRPDLKPALYGQGLTLARLGKWEESHAAFAALAARDSFYEAVASWVDFSERVVKGRLSGEAVLLYEEAQQRGISDEARLSLLSHALERSPEFCEALAESASMAARAGDSERALALSAKALASAAGPRQRSFAAAAAAETNRRAGRLDDALARYDEALEHAVAAQGSVGGTERRASLLYLKALACHDFERHEDADRALRALLDQRLPLATFQPGARALAAVDARVASDSPALALAPAVESGQVFVFAATVKVESIGPSPHVFALALTAVARIEAVPARGGVYRVRLTFRNVPDSPQFAALAELDLTLAVSPWFGLLAPPLKPGAPGYDMTLPLIHALCEVFTIAPANAHVPKPYRWANPNTAGVVHLESMEEAAWLADYDNARYTLARVALADFPDPESLIQRYEPRQRIDARVTFDTSTRLPREATLSVMRSRLAPEKNDVETHRTSVTLTRRE